MTTDGNDSSSDPLKIQLKTVVKKTNGLLGDLEERFKKATEPLAGPVEQAKAKWSDASRVAQDVYERRHEYGTLLTAGTAGLAGGTTFVRRWRILPAVVSAAVAGTVTYGLVYGLDEIFETTNSSTSTTTTDASSSSSKRQ
jgi:hypothetical protein